MQYIPAIAFAIILII